MTTKLFLRDLSNFNFKKMFKKFTWGHGIAIALGAFMIFILSMIFIFTRGWQNSELITDNYYEEELVYQQVIDAKKNADQLAEKPQYIQDATGIRILFPKDISNANSKFKIDLHRADDQRLDIKRAMTLDNQNSIHIPSKVLTKGNYVLRTLWTKDQKNYQMDYDLVW